VLALERGSPPGLAVDLRGGSAGFADHFSDCDGVAPPTRPLLLPALSREALAHAQARLQHERDSLARRATLFADTARVLETRVRELEAELKRIRRLLGAPETLGVSRPPGP